MCALGLAIGSCGLWSGIVSSQVQMVSEGLKGCTINSPQSAYCRGQRDQTRRACTKPITKPEGGPLTWRRETRLARHLSA